MKDLEYESAVEATSDDAAISKLSSARLGYFKDDFMQYFVSKRKITRRSPIINRGYFARVAARDKILLDFLRLTGTEIKKQIVSLGAGSDTLYFRLLQDYPDDFKNLVKFVELDLPAVVRRKKKIIEATPELKSRIEGTLDVYALEACDITDTEALEKVFRSIPNFSFTTPTLFLSECVLVYLTPSESLEIIRSLKRSFLECAVFVYEQIRPDDAFGKVMMENLASRGCPLKGLPAHKSPEMQIERFTVKGGFEYAECLDMNDVYYKVLPKEVVRRAEHLEIFDEYEEWHLMSAHYAITLARHYSDSSSVLAQLSLEIRS